MNEIARRINELIKMPNSREKDIKVYQVLSYIYYLKTLKSITKTDYETYKELIELVFSQSSKVINEERKIQKNEFFAERSNLLNLYKDVLLFSNDYKFDIQCIGIGNASPYMYTVTDFFKWFDKDLLNIYIDLENKGLIHDMRSNEYGGLSTCIGKNEYAIFLNRNLCIVNQLITVIHEMAHVYCYHRNQDSETIISNYLATECISKTLENLFLIYLRENNLINKDMLKEYEINSHITNLLSTDSAYVTNCLLIERNTTVLNIEDVSFSDYKEKSILSPKKYRYYTDHMKYNQNQYAYAFLFASIMENRFMKDPTWTKNFIKEYPLLINELNTNQILNMFDRSEYIESANKCTRRILTKKKK